MKTKKLLSLLLALMMMLSVVPMYASAAETLTTSSIQTLPTVLMKTPDVTSYIYGTTYEEIFTIADDEVVVDAAGNQVAGHFELKAPNACWDPSVETLKRVNLVFVPDDASAYTSFNKNRVSVESFGITIKKSTMKLVDEINDPPVVEGTYASGKPLSEITITGGVVVNSINSEANLGISNPPVWRFANADQTITESGYYTAYVAGAETYFETFEYPVYITVESSVVVPEITEAPTATITYGQAWSDVTLTGGKVMAGDTEVAGKFTIDNAGTSVPNAGTYTPAVIFTPDDLEKYTTCEGTATVTVNPAPIKFVDENGADIVPEITVDYGTKFRDISRLLKPYVKGPEYVYFVMGDLGSQLCSNGTYTVTATAPDDSKNYEDTELTFKIVVEPKVINPKAYSSTEGYYVYDNSGVYNVEGTFDFYIDGELYKSGVKYLEKVAYEPETSGEHIIKFVYKPVENDNFAIENEITATVTVNLVHKLTLSDNIIGKSGDYRYGTAIELVANIAAESFAGWKITDAKGNEVTLDGVDLTATNITFTMPDYDIHVEALKKSTTGGDSGIELPDLDLDLDFDTDGTHKFGFVNLIQNLVEMIKAFIQQIGDFFSNLSLDSLGETIG